MQFLNVKRLDKPVGSLKLTYNKAPDQRSWVIDNRDWKDEEVVPNACQNNLNTKEESPLLR